MMRNRSLRRLRWRVAVRTNGGVALYRRAPGSRSYTLPRAHWMARSFSRQDAARVLRLRMVATPISADYWKRFARPASESWLPHVADLRCIDRETSHEERVRIATRLGPETLALVQREGGVA